MTVSQQLQSGLALHQAGKIAEAEAIYRRVLAQDPKQADALHLLGVLLGQNGRPQEGEKLIRNALRIRPDYAEALSNLGIILANSGDAPGAVASLRRAVHLRPDLVDAHFYLGNALLNLRKMDEAIKCYRHVLKVRPDFARAHSNLGTALRDKRLLDQAIDAYQRAIALEPDLAMAHCNLASALGEAGQFDGAISEFRRALALDPHYAMAHSNLIFMQMYLPDYTGQMIFDELRRWNDIHARPLKRFIQPHENERNPDRRLRIGYISPDFRDHVVGRNIRPLLRHHDHANFEIYCYAHLFNPDEQTAEFKKYADVWRDIGALSDAQAADLIRKDRIDILVDLTLHTGFHRLLVSARKPAPIQVAFAGYPGSTGLETMDYRLTDPYLDPPGESDPFSSETPIRLPNSFWCYDPAGMDVAVSPLPAESNGFITFGCLNNFMKMNGQVVRLWARILRAVEWSRMLLLCPLGPGRGELLDLLQGEGIAADRIEFTANRARAKYLELYHRIDIGLDTFPYNGHTTSLDSYWMGVPVVTLVGQTIVGRAGLSQLTNLGLTEFIANTPDEYVRIATGLAGDFAGDRERLRILRQKLRARMEKSPLMDAIGFARGIEAAYRAMWNEYCRSQKPTG